MAGYKKNMAQYENLEGWEKLSLGMQLDKWAIRYGNRIAVTDSEEEITYNRYWKRVTAPHDVMISHPEEVAKILLEN